MYTLSFLLKLIPPEQLSPVEVRIVRGAVQYEWLMHNASYADEATPHL